MTNSHPFDGLHFTQSRTLPMPPTDREVALRIVRHGLAPVLRWLGENVGPRPFDKTHALLMGDAVYVSPELWSVIEDWAGSDELRSPEGNP